MPFTSKKTTEPVCLVSLHVRFIGKDLKNWQEMCKKQGKKHRNKSQMTQLEEFSRIVADEKHLRKDCRECWNQKKGKEQARK